MAANWLRRLLSAPITATVLAVVLTVFGAAYLDSVENRAYRIQERNMITRRAVAVRSSIEQAIGAHVGSLLAAEALVHASPEINREVFMRTAAVLLEELPAALEIQLAPDGVVRFVHPAYREAAVLGIDLLSLSIDQSAVVALSMRDGQTRVAGPVELVQGGVALIDYDEFISSIPNLDDPGIEFAIRGRDGLGEIGDIFFGSEELFENDTIMARVEIPGGNWQLAARPEDGWARSRPNGLAFRGLSVLLVICVGWLTYSARSRAVEVQRLATSDSLTGLATRRLFFDLGRVEMMRARRYGHGLAVLVLDIDHFKEVNDTWGHPAGDAVLSAIADRITSAVRTSDTVGRIGGEEFAVLAPETNVAQAEMLGERLRASVAGLVVEVGGQQIVRTTSVGIAAIANGDEEVFEAILERADGALYAAKRQGRNRVCVADMPGEPE